MNTKILGVAFLFSVLMISSAFAVKRSTKNFTEQAKQYIQLSPEEVAQKNKKSTVKARVKKNNPEVLKKFLESQRNPKARKVPTRKVK
ncbi:hypothetical protein K9M41_01670 [Candidatus Gracilibacteria bacterium]|nr:hypothetical protein [Candidatus Gracilibacteria bacterium]